MTSLTMRRGLLRRWLFKGISVPATTATLRYRRIYIIPTRNGLMFAFMLLVMWLGAINYGNSLAFMLAFLLGSLAMVSILHTFRNLVGLRVSSGEPAPVFAGDTAFFPVLMENPARRRRIAIGLQHKREMQGNTDVGPSQTQRLELRVPAPQRGWLVPDRFALFTIFPLGLFRAWSWLDLDMRCLVYPLPEAGTVPAPPGGRSEAQGGRRGSGQDDFNGLRRYRAGDSLRQVSWRHVARGLDPQTKTFTGEALSDLWLDWHSLGELPGEARLSRLCRWILDAERDGRRYGLRLPQVEITPSSGPAHRHRCLRALALHPT